MIIHTLWVQRKEQGLPELVEAWDEYVVDSFPEGFETACEKALGSYGTEEYEHRFIDIEIPTYVVQRAFRPTMITKDDAKVVPSAQDWKDAAQRLAIVLCTTGKTSELPGNILALALDHEMNPKRLTELIG